MLLYQPPFLTVDRLTLFPDHVDPETFYYLVSVPELVRRGDEPAFWATAILRAVSVSGAAPAAEHDVARMTLSFDTQLAATAAELDLARKTLIERRGREQVKLAPAPLAAGKAILTVARPATPESDREVFVHSGHPPSLIGDNRAAFAAAAAGREAEILAASIHGGHLAAVVAYELDFLGLTPAFRARMKVHWDLVYTHFTERRTENYVFYSDQLEQTIDDLKQTRAVEVEIEELDPELKAEAARSLWNELKAQILEKLFEPAFTAGDAPIEERIGRGVREVLSSLLPGYHHALRTLDQTALSQTTIDLSEQAARIYHHHPQTTLAGLLARAGAASRLQIVHLDSLPDRVEEIRIEVAPVFERLGIRRVLVDVEARDDAGAELATASYTFDGTDQPQVFRVRRRGAAEPRLRWRAAVELAPGHAPADLATWAADWREVDGARVYVDPEGWIGVTTLRIELDDPAILALPATVEMHVEARLPGEASPFRSEDLVFTAAHTSQTFTAVVPRGVTAVISGAEVLRRPNEAELRRAFDTITGPVHRIRNPFARAWRMEVHAAATWTATTALVAEFRVWEPARRIWLVAEHRFTAAAPVYTLAFATAPETPLAAEVRLTRITPASLVVRGPWQDLTGRVVRVTDAVEPRRRIRVTVHARRWAELRVKRVSVELEYQVPDGPLATTLLAFTRDGQVQDWTHDLPDPSRGGYRWRARAIDEDHARWSHPWTDAADDDLAVELPDDPFTA
jgi:hypothetical protein